MKKEPSKCIRTSSKTAISLNLSNIFTICQHLPNSSRSKIKYLNWNAWAIASLAKAFNSHNGNSERLYFGGLQNNCRWWLQPWNQKMLAPWKKSYDQPGQHIKKQGHYFANKGPSSQNYDFSSGPVWMWELNCEERWASKNWCFWTVVLGKTLESPLDRVRSNLSILKEISPACSLEGLMQKLKLQYFGHLMRRVDSLEKTLMLGGIGGRRRRGW